MIVYVKTSSTCRKAIHTVKFCYSAFSHTHLRVMMTFLQYLKWLIIQPVKYSVFCK